MLEFFPGNSSEPFRVELPCLMSSAPWRDSNYTSAGARRLRKLVNSPDLGVSTLVGSTIEVVYLSAVPVREYKGAEMKRYYGDVLGCSSTSDFISYRNTPGESLLPFDLLFLVIFYVFREDLVIHRCR